MERVLVTGAGGFIGSHLVDHLLARGAYVTAIDVAGPLPPRLSHAEGTRGLDYRQINVTDEACVDLVAAGGFDTVFHLASVVGVARYVQNPLATIDTIVAGTRNVIRGAQISGPRVVFTSTSEVYGRNPAVPWREDAERVLGPTTVDRWVYSTAKALCEHMLFAASRMDPGFPVVVVRYFNVYGPRQGPDFVVSEMIKNVLAGNPPPVFDTGTQTRCFTYIDDAIKGTLLAGESSRAVGEVINIGSSRETRIAEVAELILRLASVDGELRPRSINAQEHYGSYEDIVRRVPDVSKAKKLLGWEAETPIEVGLQRTIAESRESMRRTLGLR